MIRFNERPERGRTAGAILCQESHHFAPGQPVAFDWQSAGFSNQQQKQQQHQQQQLLLLLQQQRAWPAEKVLARRPATASRAALGPAHWARHVDVLGSKLARKAAR